MKSRSLVMASASQIGVGLVGINGAAADPGVDQAGGRERPVSQDHATASGTGSPANTAGFPGRGRGARASRGSTGGTSHS